jgi:hypothetical protein
MRYTRSYARAQAAEEAQASLLQVVAQSHLPVPKHLEISAPLQIAPAFVPPVPVTVCDVSNQSVAVPSTPPVIRNPSHSIPISVRCLPIAGLKKKQERYRIALYIQWITLFGAGIPLDIICSRWHVTNSAVY